MRDSLEGIVEELRLLRPGKRRRIMAQLSTAERRTVEAMLKAEGQDEHEEAAPTADETSFLAEMSPWLSERVAARLQPGATGLTPAGRAALRDALATLSRPAGELPKQTPTPPLAALIGRRFGSRRQRA